MLLILSMKLSPINLINLKYKWGKLTYPPPKKKCVKRTVFNIPPPAQKMCQKDNFLLLLLLLYTPWKMTLLRQTVFVIIVFNINRTLVTNKINHYVISTLSFVAIYIYFRGLDSKILPSNPPDKWI